MAVTDASHAAATSPRLPPLTRLVPREALARLIEAAAALAPGSATRVQDSDGRAVVGAAAGGSHVREAIVVDEVVLGWVEVSGGPSDTSKAVAAFVARAVEVAAAEGLRRRAVGAAAIEDLRELSLLSRLAEMLGESVDADAIARCTLDTVSRPLAPVAGVVLGPNADSVLASRGDAADISDLAIAAAPVVERLGREDPADGVCADLEAPVSGRLGSIVVAFLRTARGHQGAIALGRRPGAHAFTQADRRLVAAAAAQAAVAIERAALQAQVARRQVLDRELEIGRRIQISLMPRRFPEVPGWEIASAYEPAREVGGDFYDAFALRDRPGHIGLVVADVTGKGIPAAILMADSRALIHAAADQGGEPAETLSIVNRILVSERASGLFVTVGHAVLDTSTGRLRYASAGHDPVHVLHADGSLDVIDPAGRLVGMVADLGVTGIELELHPGDAWIGHTDGITEARDLTGAFYGEDRFRDLLRSLAGRSADEIVSAIRTDVASFRGAAEPSDDLTLLVVGRAPDGPVRAADA